MGMSSGRTMSIKKGGEVDGGVFIGNRSKRINETKKS